MRSMWINVEANPNYDYKYGRMTTDEELKPPRTSDQTENFGPSGHGYCLKDFYKLVRFALRLHTYVYG